ncbi:MAG: S1 RNA-binding domain-containing protein [bacterium]|jgi:S1 RNA binding domain protein
MSLEVGSIVEGKVTGITNFGAFVSLPGGSTGLVHISEVADAYVHDVKDYLKENDKIKVKVISIKEGKIGLSIRQVNKPDSKQKPMSRSPRHSHELSFEDKLARFLKESDERQTDLRRSTDAKRGGRGTKYS